MGVCCSRRVTPCQLFAISIGGGLFGPELGLGAPIGSSTMPSFCRRSRLATCAPDRRPKDRLCIRCGVPFVVENPRASWLWKLPCWTDIVASPHTHLCCADQCMYGARWRKRTGLLVGNISPESYAKLEARCNGKRSVCDRTCVQHILLIGSDGHGVCWTNRLSSPRALPTACSKMPVRRSLCDKGLYTLSRLLDNFCSGPSERARLHGSPSPAQGTEPLNG